MRSNGIRILVAGTAVATVLGLAGTAGARPTSTAPAGTTSASPGATSPSGNLLTGTKGTFDTDTGGWSASPGKLSVVRSPVYAGRGALSVKAPAGGVTNSAALSGTDRSSWTSVSPGWTYQATAQLRAASTGRVVQPVLSWFSADGTALGYAWGAPTTDRAGAWTAGTPVSGLAPATAAYASFGLIWYGTAGNEVHYVDSASMSAAAPHALLGVYDPPFGANGDPAQLRAMEAWQAKENAVVGLYTSWEAAAADRLFNSQLPAAWAEGSVPMVSWMPWIGNDKGVDYAAQIASGAWDAYILDWATRMKQFLAGPDATYGNADDRRVFVRFAHEANGNWYPYSPAYGATPATSYVDMWRRVHDLVMGVGLDAAHLAWVWSVNNDDAYPGPVAEQLYPGDAYVDWVGIDGYNWGNLHEPAETWETPEQVFGPMSARLRALTTKPLSVNEVGVTASGYGGNAKSDWIPRYFAWAAANGVRMTAWFNDYPDLWAVFAATIGDEWYTAGGVSYLAFSSYRTAVGASWLQPSNRQNPRLITDAQFAGR